jgi:hypothetical protein
MLSLATVPSAQNVNDQGPFNEAQRTFAMLMGGQVLGLGIGELSWRLTGASAGDVSLTGSGGIWTTALTMLTLAAADVHADARSTALAAMIASDLGLLGGAVLARYYPVSRGHALLLDLGGGLGTLIGLGSVVLLAGDHTDGRAAAAGAAAGAVAGLGLTAFLTRSWDLPDVPPVQVGVGPTQGGAIVLVGLGW